MPETKDEISISRAKLDSITVYDVTEEELETIERGSPSSTYLNFSIALLSIFVSTLATMCVTRIEDDRVFMGFMSICVLTFISGVVLLFLWIRSNKDTKSVFNRIRGRKAANKIRETTVEPQIQEPLNSNGPKG